MSEDIKDKKSLRERWRELRQRNKTVRILTDKFLVVTVIFAVFVIFLDSNSLIQWGKDKFQVMEQKKTIRQYRKDIREVDDKLKELSSNRDSLEKFAREQYYFQEKDEDVFIVE